MSTWCVKHRDGWCAVEGNKKPSEGATSVATRCLHFVVLPWGFERRRPDCAACLEVTGVSIQSERQYVEDLLLTKIGEGYRSTQLLKDMLFDRRSMIHQLMTRSTLVRITENALQRLRKAGKIVHKEKLWYLQRDGKAVTEKTQ